MKSMLSFLRPGLAALLLTAAGGLLTAQNATLSVQGILKKADGVAVDDGAYNLTFRLYTQNGVNPVWDEVQSDIEVIGGVYSVILGSVEPFTGVSFGEPYFLGISINNGQELSPRVRLTSAPYALALLGSDNVFPNAGNVGIGTTTPTQLLDVDGTAKALTVKANVFDAGNATTDGYLRFFGPGGGAGDFAQLQWNQGDLFFNMGASSTIQFRNDFATNYHFSNTQFTSSKHAEFVSTVTHQGATTFNGAASFVSASTHTGTATFNGLAQFNNYAVFAGSQNTSINGSQCFLHVGECDQEVNTNGNWNLSMKADNGIWAEFFIAQSDRRIKKDFRRSDSRSDLETLKKIRITDYAYIDQIGKGGRIKKGVIAQEVKEVVPEAVGTGAEFIPSVYALATRVVAEKDRLTVELPKAHGFKTGDLVRLILAGRQVELPVEEILSETGFRVNGWDGGAVKALFVFGQQVDDFHSVDYDHLFALNLSATQELVRRVEALEAQNAAWQQRQQAVETQLGQLATRLQALENPARPVSER
jgi:hypothetical protein